MHKKAVQLQPHPIHDKESFHYHWNITLTQKAKGGSEIRRGGGVVAVVGGTKHTFASPSPPYFNHHLTPIAFLSKGTKGIPVPQQKNNSFF